ncbi:hypothetical protein IFR35_10460 [Pseudomonas fluorescens]|uniref:hypothetical protein n=1 Tax=Pseudomonas fluorescens TaxID=294 RepID=UPI001783FDCE|nr:hypothetical protein [Pseudomonas fluorescens]MBD8192293.1 hypothetical protein [Pseudomonas fluorescens]MBD8226917.1 hypothetical protein [Pseudomonas fluorescens]MBD8784630.1 hypothetical protein [Pseudomonas fluorescens]MBD8817310.1 hypothetical protein [Pseudomonas fluorescens]
MKKSIRLCFFVALAASSVFANAETFERIELDKDRTSIQYAGPIKSITKALEGYRWLGQTKDMDGGVVFEPYENTRFGKNDTETGGAIMVKATYYLYEKPVKEAVMIARQSQIPGFVEFYNLNSRELQLHIRMVDADTFQAFSSDDQYQNPAKNLMTYKKVDQFNKGKYKDKLKSAEESGMIF